MYLAHYKLESILIITIVMAQEPDLEVLANMLEAIQDTVRLVGPALLTQEQLGQAFERFRAVLDDSAKRRKERSAITTGEDFDDEEAEALEVSCQDSSNSTI